MDSLGPRGLSPVLLLRAFVCAADTLFELSHKRSDNVDAADGRSGARRLVSRALVASWTAPRPSGGRQAVRDLVRLR
jgi:hypothetical protein